MSTQEVPAAGASAADFPESVRNRLDGGGALAALVRSLPPEETPYAIHQLDEDDRTRFFERLLREDPDLTADILEHFPDLWTAQLLEGLSRDDAATVVDEMDSDEQADVLSSMDSDVAAEILEEMDPGEAADTRARLTYDEDSAGGLMITEIIAYPAETPVREVLSDLQARYRTYSEYETRYVYAVDSEGGLAAVVPMRRLAISDPDRPVGTLGVSEPVVVRVDDALSRLEDLFDRLDVSVLPVVSASGRLAGAVARAAVHEALSERETRKLMKFGGIVGGEELRSMPLGERILRRSAFLLPSVALSYVSVTIIAAYEPTIHQLTALAIFLPMVANLSGAAGNQAVAVSIRELSIGVVRSRDLLRVWKQELPLGLANGALIGALLSLLTWLTRPEDVALALAIGGAYVASSALAVLCGGSLPLLLQKLGVDPAMLSSPVLTTLTDMASFLFVLSAAAQFVL